MSMPIGRLCAITLLLAGAAPGALVAQGITTSALMGTVRDPSGKPIAGALVRVSSPSLIGGERTLRTKENGTYRFAVLPPGRYRVVVEAPGFSPLTGSELLELGRSSTLNWKFAAASSAVVEVVGGAERQDSAPMTLTQNFNTDELATLPAERSIGGIMNLAPGVNDNKAWGGNRRENAYMMDGVNMSDPSGGTVWIFPNPDWFSEIQVGGIGASAEYGSYNGGFVNGLIKRGGNTFEGSLNAYYGDTKWQATSSNSKLEAADKAILPAKDWDIALNVGGPIVKDKLWFFASAERVQADESRPGALEPYKSSKTLFLGKLTWQVIPSATLEGLFEYDYMHVDRRGIDKYTLPVASVLEKAPNRSYGFTWTQTLDSDKVLTVKLLGYSGRYDLLPYGGNAAPLDAYDYYKGIEYYGNTTWMDRNYRGRTTLSATFDWFKTDLMGTGNHAFRFGLEREQSTDEERRSTPGGIQYSAYTGDNGSGGEALFTDEYMIGGGWNIQQRINRLAAFVQDEWKLNDRLTLRPGLRFEQFQARYYGASNLWDKKTLAPRFGFNLALTRDASTMLKGHWGRYFAAYSTYFIDRANETAKPKATYYDWQYGTQIDPLNPATWPVADPAHDTVNRVVGDVARVDPDAKHPYTDELTFSLEQRFKGALSAWTVSGSWVYRQFKDLLVRRDLTPDPTGTWTTATNPITGATIPIYESGLPADGHDYLVTNDDRAKRRYWSASLALDRRMADHWSFNGTYTRARSSGNVTRGDGYDDTFINPNNLTNADGRLPGYNDDEFKARFIVELPWAMRVSGTYTFLSGERWTPYYRTAKIPIRYYINTETRGSETYPSRSLVDLRLTQQVPFGKQVKAEAFAEVFNVFNSGTTLSWTERINSSSYLYPDSVETGRRLRLGCRITF